MQIKKVKSTKNEYAFAGGLWVRNFCKKDSKPILENNLLSKYDHELIIHNECVNKTSNIPDVAEEQFFFPNVVIVSDGYNFKKLHQLLGTIEEPIYILAVNRALKYWQMPEKPINFYIVNNPYEDCMSYISHQYFPACIASTRTHASFLEQYQGMKFLYEPTPEIGFGHRKLQRYYIDDYRNPISAALNLAYHFHASKILLFCCDDSFKDKKEGAINLPNGLWTYPQQIKAQEVIDGQCFWLTLQKIKVGNFSLGRESNYATYIKDEEQLKLFFKEDENAKF